MCVYRKDYKEEPYEYLEEDFGIKELATSEFELIEDQTIDIESIEEIDNMTPLYDYWWKINELVRAVNTLTKKYKK